MKQSVESNCDSKVTMAFFPNQGARNQWIVFVHLDDVFNLF